MSNKFWRPLQAVPTTQLPLALSYIILSCRDMAFPKKSMSQSAGPEHKAHASVMDDIVLPR